MSSYDNIREQLENMKEHEKFSWLTYTQGLIQYHTLGDRRWGSLSVGYIHTHKKTLDKLVRVGYIRLCDANGAIENSYYTRYTFERTAKKIIRRKSRKRQHTGLYKYNFEMSFTAHRQFLKAEAPWREFDKALYKLGAERAWWHLPYITYLARTRRYLYSRFVKQIPGARCPHPFLASLHNGELLLTLLCVKLAKNEEGETYFKTLTHDEALEKLQSFVAPAYTVQR